MDLLRRPHFTYHIKCPFHPPSIVPSRNQAVPEILCFNPPHEAAHPCPREGEGGSSGFREKKMCQIGGFFLRVPAWIFRFTIRRMVASFPTSPAFASRLGRVAFAKRPRGAGRTHNTVPISAWVFTRLNMKTTGVNNCSVIRLFAATHLPLFRHERVSFIPAVVETVATPCYVETYNLPFSETASGCGAFLG